MSLFPLDLNRFKEWSVRQAYYLLFPYIKRDFMGRLDCRAVHTEGNMTVTTETGPVPVVHIIRGGSDSFISAKEAEYRILAEEGRVVLEGAEETGQFLG